jgi:hypothetical protein
MATSGQYETTVLGQLHEGLTPKPPAADYEYEARLITEPIPIWEEDEYDSKEHYEQEMVELVESLFEESREKYEKKKMQWASADKLIELEHILDSLVESHPEKTRIPYLPQAIEEWLAVRHGDNLRPSAAARQQAFDKIVAAGNYIMDRELDANLYNLLRLRIGIDQLKCRIGFMGITVDKYATGIFGQPGEHRLQRIDPRYVWPDPHAESWQWRDMKYLIIARPMDMSDVRKLWPDKAGKVKPMSSLSWADGREELNPDNTRGTQHMDRRNGKGEYQIGKRDRVLVMECYVRDGRTRRVPQGYDEFGEPIKNADGSIACEYVERYPRGRLIIVANGVLLRDTQNPWNHGEPPLVPFPASVTDGLFSYSPLKLLDLVDRKLNLLVKEAYASLRVHLTPQWVVDRNAFTKPSQYDEITQSPKTVFIVRPQSRIMRLPPGELPQQLFPFFEYLKDVFDQNLGVTKIDRGQLEKGSQLSAQSVIELQGAAGTRALMNKQLDREAVKQVGMKLFWNIRQFHRKKMTIIAKDPVSGEDQQLEWDSESFGTQPWDFKMEAGDTGSAEATAQDRAVKLYDRGIIDNEEVLRVLNWTNSGTVLKRMREERGRLAQLGFVKEALQHGVVSKAMSQRGPKKMGEGV